MRLATLITNTDFSEFAKARPHDGIKFRELIQLARPNWSSDDFWVCLNEFPENIDTYDGVMITGSPASANDAEGWITRLEDLVRQIIAARQPLFGACFGHQIIAKALGAPIIHNPAGWGHGLLEIARTNRFPWSGKDATLLLYGSHMEQVGALPQGSHSAFEGDGLPIAGYVMGEHVFTVQHHPEMTHDFMIDLVEFYADDVGPEATHKARHSLQRRSDQEVFAGEIARFFEHATKAGGH